MKNFFVFLSLSSFAKIMRFPDTQLCPVYHNNLSNGMNHNVVKKIKHQNIHLFNDLKQNQTRYHKPLCHLGLPKQVAW